MTRCAFLIVFVFLGCQGSAQENTSQPNIVLIMADDLGYGDISCFGSDFIQTPVLDKMAAEGIKFTDFHSNGAVCTPTRASLITGNYQQKAGLEGVIYVQKEKRIYGISPQEKTMAEIFKDAGYKTGIFGKWHLGYKSEFNPTYHGFDEFYGYVSGNVDYISHRDGIGVYDWWHNTDTSYDKGYVTDLITDQALKFMESNTDHPLFLPFLCRPAIYQDVNRAPQNLARVTGRLYRFFPDKESEGLHGGGKGKTDDLCWIP